MILCYFPADGADKYAATLTDLQVACIRFLLQTNFFKLYVNKKGACVTHCPFRIHYKQTPHECVNRNEGLRVYQA